MEVAWLVKYNLVFVVGWGATEAVKPQTNIRIKIESGCNSNDEIKMSPMDPISKNEQGQMIIEHTGKFMSKSTNHTVIAWEKLYYYLLIQCRQL